MAAKTRFVARTRTRRNWSMSAVEQFCDWPAYCCVRWGRFTSPASDIDVDVKRARRSLAPLLLLAPASAASSLVENGDAATSYQTTMEAVDDRRPSADSRSYFREALGVGRTASGDGARVGLLRERAPQNPHAGHSSRARSGAPRCRRTPTGVHGVGRASTVTAFTKPQRRQLSGARSTFRLPLARRRRRRSRCGPGHEALLLGQLARKRCHRWRRAQQTTRRLVHGLHGRLGQQVASNVLAAHARRLGQRFGGPFQERCVV